MFEENLSMKIRSKMSDFIYIWDLSRAHRNVYVAFAPPVRRKQANTLPGGIAGGVGSEVVPTLASDASALLFRAR